MGSSLSVIVPPVVEAIRGLVSLFVSKPEQENTTVTAVQNRFTQPGRIIDMEEEEEDSGESTPLSLSIANITKRINTYLQTRMATTQLRPTVWPTEKQFNDAKEKFGYTPGNLHFAVTGIAGSGKSSLVNSFRGLRAGDPGAAKTGVNETTREAGRYPHPDQESPLARIVWYDIPGAGTQTTPGGSAYFNSQGLFIFDFIIVVTGDRFTEQDLDILANCKMYNIPSFVVRPKADIHIRNIESDEDYGYQDARKMYINETRNRFKEELRVAAKKVDLGCDKEIFLVSKKPLLDIVRSFMDGKAPNSAEALIDEQSLVTKILLAAQMRRYPSSYGVGWALLKIQSLGYVFPD